AKFRQAMPQLFHVLKRAHPQELLFQRADEPLHAAIAFRLAHEGRRRLHAQEGDLRLVVVAQVLAAVVVPVANAGRGPRAESAAVVAHPPPCATGPTLCDGLRHKTARPPGPRGSFRSMSRRCTPSSVRAAAALAGVARRCGADSKSSNAPSPIPALRAPRRRVFPRRAKRRGSWLRPPPGQRAKVPADKRRGSARVRCRGGYPASTVRLPRRPWSF